MAMSFNPSNRMYMHRTANNSSRQNGLKIQQYIGIARNRKYPNNAHIKQCMWYVHKLSMVLMQHPQLMAMSFNTSNRMYMHRTADNSSRQNREKIQQYIGIMQEMENTQIIHT